MTAMRQDMISVPLKIDDVVVGMVSVEPDCNLSIKFTNRSTESYLKELLLSELTESISFKIDYAGEPDDHISENNLGHLRLI